MPESRPTRPVRVLELRSVRGTGGGPEKTILSGARASNPACAVVTVCYVRDTRDQVFPIAERAAALGVDYVEVLERHSFDRRILRPLEELVRARGIDVVHGHDYKADLLGLWLRRSTGVIPLSTAHGWTGHSLRERFVYYPAHKQILRRYPLVLAVSSQIREDLLRAGCRADRVRVLLNGIDSQRFVRHPERVAAARERFGVGANAFVIGAVGRLEPQKRFDLLIEAFATVSARLPHARLLIAGDGSSRAALTADCRARGLDPHSTLVGHLEDVAEFHHALDLFVQSSDYEGTPNAVLEAMALETPVIATDVGGTSEICRPDVDGLIVGPGDARALAAAIEQAATAMAPRLLRARSARRRVEDALSFERRVATLESIYGELAAGHA
jgi:glycosyltransferase involved in cell wall biosynthesis